MYPIYIRSSSYGSYSLCPHKTYLSYTLGLEENSGKSAAMGNVYHKVMEHIAKAKLMYQQTGLTGGWDVGDEYIGEFIVKDLFNNEFLAPLTKKSFEYYKGITPYLKWMPADLVNILEWVNRSLVENGGMNDPRKKNIVAVEQFFDFEIQKDWAKYDYDIDGKKISGYLRMKGTMDLVSQIDEDHYEVLDYKSGKHRSDFATGEEKTFEKLQTDPQLLIYYYACRTLFPDIKYFDFSIYFVNAGGLFTLCFNDESLEKAEEVIRDRFIEMKNDKKPRLLSPSKKEREKGNYKCYNCCHFQKFKQPGTDLSICEFYQSEIKEKGLEQVTKENCNWESFGVYGDGGGRKKEE